MEKNSYEFEAEPEKRPSFLMWLCILTFIGSGWAIVSSIWSYTSAGKTAAGMISVNHTGADSALQKDTARLETSTPRSALERKIKASFSKILNKDNIRKAAIGSFISALLTLLGALLMWNLRRPGFYIYILGVVFGMMVPFYLFGNDVIAVGVSSFGSFFGLVFIALYALNLKSMRPGFLNRFNEL